MIVSGGSRRKSKSKRSKADRTVRADQLLRNKLRAAVADGTLRDLLWNPVVNTTSSHQTKRSTVKKYPYDDDDTEYMEVEPFDEIRIWNELLTARVLKTRRKKFVFADDSARTLDAIDDYSYGGFENSHSSEMFGQTPPLIPMRPPTESGIQRPASNAQFIGGDQTFVTLDAMEGIPTLGRNRAWVRRNGVIISEADHARIMVELQKGRARTLLPSNFDRDPSTSMTSVFDTNHPASSGSDSDGGLEMTDELEDDFVEPRPENAPALTTCADTLALQSLSLDKMPSMAQRSMVVGKGSQQQVAVQPSPVMLRRHVRRDEKETTPLNANHVGDNEEADGDDKHKFDRRSRRGGFVGNFAEPLYEKLALMHDQNYSEVKEMQWMGIKSEQVLQSPHDSRSSRGSIAHAAGPATTTGAMGAEMGINDLQDILRASNELRHEREKIIGNSNMRLYEIDEKAKKAQDLKVWEKLLMANHMLSDEHESADALMEIKDRDDVEAVISDRIDAGLLPLDDGGGERMPKEDEGDRCILEEHLPSSRMDKEMISAIESFVAALLQSALKASCPVVDATSSDDAHIAIAELSTEDKICPITPIPEVINPKTIVMGPPISKMPPIPFQRVRAKMESQLQTATADPISSQPEASPSDAVVVDQIPAIIYSSSKALLGFSLPSKRGIINKVDPRRNSTVSISTGSIITKERIRNPLPAPSLPERSVAMIVENSLRGTRTTRRLTSRRVTQASRRDSDRSNSSSSQGLFADKSVRYAKKSSASVTSTQRDPIGRSASLDEEGMDSDSSLGNSRSSNDDVNEDGDDALSSAHSGSMDDIDDDYDVLDRKSSYFDDNDYDSSSSEFTDILSDKSYSEDEEAVAVLASEHILRDDNQPGDDGANEMEDAHPSDVIEQLHVDYSDSPQSTGSRKVDLVNENQIRITTTNRSYSGGAREEVVDGSKDLASDADRRRTAPSTFTSSSYTGIVEQKLFRVQSGMLQTIHHSKVSKRVMQHYQKYHIPFVPPVKSGRPSSPSPQGHNDNPLAGIWPYDASIAAFNALLDLVKMRQRRSYARKRVWLKKKSFDRRKVGVPRVPYPLKYYRSDIGFQEVSFDPATNCLTFSRGSIRGGMAMECVSVDIRHIFVSSSLYPDMVTLRTDQLHLVSGGYLGSFRISTWKCIKAELHTSLIYYRRHRASQTTEHKEDSTSAAPALPHVAATAPIIFDDSVFMTESGSIGMESKEGFITQYNGPDREATSGEAEKEIGMLQGYAEQGYAFFQRLSAVSRSHRTDLRGLHDLAYDSLAKLNFIVNKHYYYRSTLSSPWMDREATIGTAPSKVQSSKIKARRDSQVLQLVQPQHGMDHYTAGDVVAVTGMRPSGGILSAATTHGGLMESMASSSTASQAVGEYDQRKNNNSIAHNHEDATVTDLSFKLPLMEVHSHSHHLHRANPHAIRHASSAANPSTGHVIGQPQRLIPTAPSEPRSRQSTDRLAVSQRQRMLIQPDSVTGRDLTDMIESTGRSNNVQPDALMKSIPFPAMTLPGHGDGRTEHSSKNSKKVGFILIDDEIATSETSRANSIVEGCDAANSTTDYQFDETALYDDSTSLIDHFRDSTCSSGGSVDNLPFHQ